jgi:hypothetical protein
MEPRKNIKINFQGSLKVSSSWKDKQLVTVIQVDPPINVLGACIPGTNRTLPIRDKTIKASEIEVYANSPDFQNFGKLYVHFKQGDDVHNLYHFSHAKQFESVADLETAYKTAVDFIIDYHGKRELEALSIPVLKGELAGKLTP